MLKGVDHVDLVVSDMDEAIAFYTEKLGLTLRYDGRPDGGSKHTFLGNEVASFVALEENLVGAVREPPLRGHLAFTAEDVKAARKELTKRGVQITGERTDEDGRARSYYFTGPDGIRLEIYGPL